MVEEKKEVNEIVEVDRIGEEIKEILERIKTGGITLGELGTVFAKMGQVNEKVTELEKKLIEQVEKKREELRKAENKLKEIREKRRDINVIFGSIQETIQAMLGIARVSRITGSPVRATGGRGQRVFIKTTEAGLNAGLVNITGEFESMAKAVYALDPKLEGKRMDFKRKLQSWARAGLIELVFY